MNRRKFAGYRRLDHVLFALARWPIRGEGPWWTFRQKTFIVILIELIFSEGPFRELYKIIQIFWRVSSALLLDVWCICRLWRPEIVSIKDELLNVNQTGIVDIGRLKKSMSLSIMEPNWGFPSNLSIPFWNGVFQGAPKRPRIPRGAFLSGGCSSDWWRNCSRKLYERRSPRNCSADFVWNVCQLFGDE